MRGKSLHILLLGIIIIIASCNLSNNDDSKFKEKETFEFQKKSNLLAVTTQRQIGQDSLITVFNYSVESGNNLVFTYKRNVIPPNNIQDGGLVETLVFEVSSNKNRFELDATTFDSPQALYLRGCFCLLSGAGFTITTGTITGEKLSTVHWNIKADIEIETPQGSFNINFNQPFFLN